MSSPNAKLFLPSADYLRPAPPYILSELYFNVNTSTKAWRDAPFINTRVAGAATALSVQIYTPVSGICQILILVY